MPDSATFCRSQKAERGVRQKEREIKEEMENLLNLKQETRPRAIIFESTSEISTKLERLIAGLEECNVEGNPTKSTKLWGSWQLQFTNSPPMVKNNGITGLGSLPFASLVELEQNLFSNNTAETIERLNIPPFGTVCSSLRGPLVAATPQVVVPYHS